MPGWCLLSHLEFDPHNQGSVGAYVVDQLHLHKPLYRGTLSLPHSRLFLTLERSQDPEEWKNENESVEQSGGKRAGRQVLYFVQRGCS